MEKGLGSAPSFPRSTTPCLSPDVEFAPVVEEEVTDFNVSVKGLFKRALEVDGVVKGLHEVAKHIEAGKVQMAFLATSRDENTYKKLIQNL